MHELGAADGQEPITHALHQHLVELLNHPDKLNLYEVHEVGDSKQLHLRIRVTCGDVKRIADVLVGPGRQVSVVRSEFLPEESLRASAGPVRLRVANRQYMVGGRMECHMNFGFINHLELSKPEKGKLVKLSGGFSEAVMEWDLILGFEFIAGTNSGIQPAQCSMTLYEGDRLSWLSSSAT